VTRRRADLHALWKAAWRMAALVALLLAQTPVLGESGERFATGHLWRISKPGVGDSFVFGTIHVADPRVAAVAARAQGALAQSRVLAMELVPEVADGTVLELEQLDDNRRLESLIGAEPFAQLRSELVEQGLPIPVIERLKPWAAMVKIARLPTSVAAPTVDEQLLTTARVRGLRVTSLELVDEQIAAFDSVPLDSQVAMLKHALVHRAALATTVEPTIDAWLRGDIASLAKMPDRLGARFPAMGAHYRAFAKHVIDGRTVLMHYRLYMPMREGRVFAAIGAAHLPGRHGLLALLERDGYRVTRMW
jgi:uncharacterized protein YbaP (TraB family)